MKLLRFLNYDVNEGLFRFWKRYLPAIFLEVMANLILDSQLERLLDLYQLSLSPLEYGLNQFWGRYPFHYDPSAIGENFELPFAWLLQYFLLAYCIGSHVRDDMQGFGTQMMARSGQRRVWWLSKVLWAVLVNLVYFALLWCANIGYAWIASGDVRLVAHRIILASAYGAEMASTGDGMLLLLGFGMPLLAGIVQSLFQLIGTVCIGGIPTMVLLTAVLVLSSYYANPFLVHGYAMVCRYYHDGSFPDYQPLDAKFGVAYLLAWTAALAVAGYLILRRKDILGNRA